MSLQICIMACVRDWSGILFCVKN